MNSSAILPCLQCVCEFDQEFPIGYVFCFLSFPVWKNSSKELEKKRWSQFFAKPQKTLLSPRRMVILNGEQTTNQL